MNTDNNNINKSDEAFEFLVKRNQDEKRMKEWAKEYGRTSEYQSKKETRSRIKPLRVIYIFSSIAAIGVLLIAFVLNSNFSIDSHSNDLIASTTISSEYRGGTRGKQFLNASDENILWFSKIQKAVYEKDYSQAIGLFRQYEKNNTLEVEDKYFFALSLLKTKNEDYHKAIALLTDVINADSSNNKIEALWFRALGYGSLNNEINMKSDLEKLGTLSQFKGDEIKSILKGLE